MSSGWLPKHRQLFFPIFQEGRNILHFPSSVNCVAEGFEEIRIQALTLGHLQSSSGKV
jgi:hypothetical protein